MTLPVGNIGYQVSSWVEQKVIFVEDVQSSFPNFVKSTTCRPLPKSFAYSFQSGHYIKLTPQTMQAYLEYSTVFTGNTFNGYTTNTLFTGNTLSTLAREMTVVTEKTLNWLTLHYDCHRHQYLFYQLIHNYALMVPSIYFGVNFVWICKI